jgi:hypothetical protein
MGSKSVLKFVIAGESKSLWKKREEELGKRLGGREKYILALERLPTQFSLIDEVPKCHVNKFIIFTSISSHVWLARTAREQQPATEQ